MKPGASVSVRRLGRFAAQACRPRQENTMAEIKAIRTKIKSVQNTSKITKAMEMVAASKMRKAQERMRAGRPYATKVRAIAAHLMQAHPDYTHPYMEERKDIKGV